MAYHTALALAAGRAVPITIGRRTVVARPVSVPVMLTVLAAGASGDPAQLFAAEAQLLRAAFPRPRFGWRDPLRLLAKMPADARAAVLLRLMRVPQETAVVAAAEDPYAATRAWQRAAVRPRGPSGPQPTLLLAAQACRAAYGESWYFDPARWGTVDGYVPHDVAWVEYWGLTALEARQQLMTVGAHAVAQSGKQVRRALDQLIRRAYPPDPMIAAVLHRPVS